MTQNAFIKSKQLNEEVIKMNIDDLTIGQAKELAAMFGGEKKQPDMLSHLIGQKVVIRDHKAGVFVTTLSAVNGKQWRGGVSRKIHFWSKAGAVEGIAETGICLETSRITAETITSNGQELVQIVPCQESVFTSIMGAKEWNPK